MCSPPLRVLDEGDSDGILDLLVALAQADIERLNDAIRQGPIAVVEGADRSIADPCDEDVKQQLAVIREMLG
jgi:hypothetical protein